MENFRVLKSLPWVIWSQLYDYLFLEEIWNLYRVSRAWKGAMIMHLSTTRQIVSREQEEDRVSNTYTKNEYAALGLVQRWCTRLWILRIHWRLAIDMLPSADLLWDLLTVQCVVNNRHSLRYVYAYHSKALLIAMARNCSRLERFTTFDYTDREDEYRHISELHGHIIRSCTRLKKWHLRSYDPDYIYDMVLPPPTDNEREKKNANQWRELVVDDMPRRVVLRLSQHAESLHDLTLGWSSRSWTHHKEMCVDLAAVFATLVALDKLRLTCETTYECGDTPRHSIPGELVWPLLRVTLLSIVYQEDTEIPLPSIEAPLLIVFSTMGATIELVANMIETAPQLERLDVLISFPGVVLKKKDGGDDDDDDDVSQRMERNNSRIQSALQKGSKKHLRHIRTTNNGSGISMTTWFAFARYCVRLQTVNVVARWKPRDVLTFLRLTTITVPFRSCLQQQQQQQTLDDTRPHSTLVDGTFSHDDKQEEEKEEEEESDGDAKRNKEVIEKQYAKKDEEEDGEWEEEEKEEKDVENKRRKKKESKRLILVLPNLERLDSRVLTIKDIAKRFRVPKLGVLKCEPMSVDSVQLLSDAFPALYHLCAIYTTTPIQENIQNLPFPEPSSSSCSSSSSSSSSSIMSSSLITSVRVLEVEHAMGHLLKWFPRIECLYVRDLRLDEALSEISWSMGRHHCLSLTKFVCFVDSDNVEQIATQLLALLLATPQLYRVIVASNNAYIHPRYRKARQLLHSLRTIIRTTRSSSYSLLKNNTLSPPPPPLRIAWRDWKDECVKSDQREGGSDDENEPIKDAEEEEENEDDEEEEEED